MSEWIEDPFKAVIGGTVIIAFAVTALTAGISLVGAIV